MVSFGKIDLCPGHKMRCTETRALHNRLPPPAAEPLPLGPCWPAAAVGRAWRDRSSPAASIPATTWAPITSPSARFFAAQLAPRRTLRLDAAALRGFLPHRRRAVRNAIIPGTGCCIAFCRSRRLGLGMAQRLSLYVFGHAGFPSPRCLGRSDAAMLGSLLFTFCGFNLLHFVHPNAVAVIAHIPWLLWAIDIVSRDARRRKVAAAPAAIAILTGSQLLLGYPQYVWFSLLAEAGYTAFVLYSRHYVPRRGCDAAPRAAIAWAAMPTPGRGVLLAQGGRDAAGRSAIVAELGRPQPEHAADGRRGVGANRLRPPAEPDPIDRPLPVLPTACWAAARTKWAFTWAPCR